MKPKRIFTRNVFGKPVELGGAGGGVEKVASLPIKGEEGKIYYNTTDKKYYTYTNEGGFNETGSGIETVTTFGVVPNGADMPSVDTQVPILAWDAWKDSKPLPALYYNNNNDVMKLWIVRQQDENYVIVHPLDVNPNTIFYNSTHHYYFKIAPVPYASSFNENWKPVIEYKYKPIVVCTEQTIVLPTECTFNDEEVGEVIGLPILSPSCFCDMLRVDNIQFVEIGSITYDEEPLLNAQVIMGRFLANHDDIFIMLPGFIRSVDSNPSIKQDHMYEYSILDNTFNLIDVTPRP